MNRDLHFSSGKDEWATPQDVFDELDERYGPFDLDAAASPLTAKCSRFFTEADDAISQTWSGRVFVNPPYSRGKLDRFVEHAIRQVQSGSAEVVVMLVPARTSTVWWREAFEHADEVHGRSGSITFEGAPAPAPFGSTVFVFRRRRERSWSASDGVRYSMPKRHGSRPTWYSMKHSIGGPS